MTLQYMAVLVYELQISNLHMQLMMTLLRRIGTSGLLCMEALVVMTLGFSGCGEHKEQHCQYGVWEFTMRAF